MGRPSLSAEAVRSHKAGIISGAREMIRESGIQSVSARSLGSRIGMSSALIYRYFRNIDEVIMFACVHVLHEYTSEMTAATRDREASAQEISDEDIYMLSWELFCRHAFTYPEEYNMLFFSRHSSGLHDVIREYYELFPHDRGAEDDMILEGMYRTSDLRNRNLMLLIPVLESRRSEKEIIIINDMTVSLFFALLVQLVNREQGVTADHQTERMLDACRFSITES